MEHQVSAMRASSSCGCSQVPLERNSLALFIRIGGHVRILFNSPIGRAFTKASTFTNKIECQSFFHPAEFKTPASKAFCSSGSLALREDSRSVRKDTPLVFKSGNQCVPYPGLRCSTVAQISSCSKHAVIQPWYEKKNIHSMCVPCGFRYLSSINKWISVKRSFRRGREAGRRKLRSKQNISARQ